MNTELPLRTFRCRPSLTVMMVSGLFFVGCTAILGYEALTNNKGLVLNGLVEFSRSGASYFYGVLAVISSGFVVAAAWTIFTTLYHGVPDVMLSNDTISFPVGFPIKRAYVLTYAQIADLSTTEVSGQRFLLLHTATKKHHLVLNWLESREAEQSLQRELTERWRSANG